MLETEFLFFQGMKKRIDQRISEGNYDEAAAGETDEGALEGAVKCMMEK